MAAIAIASLRRDGGTQPRDHVSLEVAREYAEAMADGATLPPVTAFYDGTDYWLADGFHRVEAALLLDQTVIDAEVHQGTRREAVLHSVGANASHGYRRSNMDKRRAVVTLLNDPEWAEWSDREIARRCSVSRMLVADLRPPKVTVSSDSEVRTYLDRHGNASHMKVAAIGKAKPALPVIAGHQTVRKPDLSFANTDEGGIGTAARITGLRPRVVAEMARTGEIEGARKESGSWTIPTAPLVEMVKTARQTPPANDPEPEPPVVYDHAANAPMMATIDTIEALIAGPAAPAMLAWWERYIGAGFAEGAIVTAFDWVRTFHAGFPAAEQKRRAMLDAINERIDADVAE